MDVVAALKLVDSDPLSYLCNTQLLHDANSDSETIGVYFSV